MKPLEEQLNDLIVDAYRSILKVEETILKRSDNIDLSINEMHMLEAVGKGKNKPKTISEIAEDLGITLPSVTVAINKLVKKGYVEKLRGEEDARIVYVTLTKQGKPTCFKYSQPAAPCPRAGKATTTSPPFWTPATSGSASAPASGSGRSAPTKR